MYPLRQNNKGKVNILSEGKNFLQIFLFTLVEATDKEPIDPGADCRRILNTTFPTQEKLKRPDLTQPFAVIKRKINKIPLCL